MRDCFLNQMPAVVADRQPYAVVGFIGCWFYIMLLELKVPVDAALWAGFIFITALRMACVSFKWKISYFLKEEQEKKAQENNLSGLHQQAVFLRSKNPPVFSSSEDSC